MNDALNKAFGYGFFFGVLLSAVPWVFLGGFMARHDLRQVAIEAKVAEYDSQTGEFKYKIVDEDSSM
jgi:hypothetical protein